MDTRPSKNRCHTFILYRLLQHSSLFLLLSTSEKFRICLWIPSRWEVICWWLMCTLTPLRPHHTAACSVSITKSQPLEEIVTHLVKQGPFSPQTSLTRTLNNNRQTSQGLPQLTKLGSHFKNIYSCGQRQLALKVGCQGNNSKKWLLKRVKVTAPNGWFG